MKRAMVLVLVVSSVLFGGCVGSPEELESEAFLDEPEADAQLIGDIQCWDWNGDGIFYCTDTTDPTGRVWRCTGGCDGNHDQEP